MADPEKSSVPTPAPSPAAGKTPPAAAPKAKRSVNNTAQAKFIADSAEILAAALDPANTDLTAPLAVAGYDAAGIAPGQALVADAQLKFGLRQEGLGGQSDAHDRLAAARVTAHDHYISFKTTARAIFPAHSDRLALGVVGDVPDDLSLFLTTARGGYTVGQGAAYTPRLTQRGYPPARLIALTAEVDALGTSDAHATSEAGDAQFSTEQRNAAYEALQVWMSEFKGVALGLFRKSPGSRRKLQI